MHPDPDYEEVMTFLVKQADSMGLGWRRHELSPGKPILVISWPGLEPELPSVMLNSHMDVVPVQCSPSTGPTPPSPPTWTRSATSTGGGRRT